MTPSAPARDRNSTTIAIVGAGFSGTALAVRLLRDPPLEPCRVVIIERSGRFGGGLAYAGHAAKALLNVPAARMSIDESRPDDFLDYLRSRGILAWPEEFVPRTLYGEYLEARLRDAAATAPRPVNLVRAIGDVSSMSRRPGSPRWAVKLADGRSVLADSVVLAIGHFRPRTPAALSELASTDFYVADPWLLRPEDRRAERVLLVGTGLTMADAACDLADHPQGPREIVAVSRRGLLSRQRLGSMPVAPVESLEFASLDRAQDLRGMTSSVRSIVAEAEAAGIDWRDVMVALRERVPDLWRRLPTDDRARFLRHLQPYWDVHRHQLPPRVGRRVQELIDQGRLRILAGRITAAEVRDGQAIVSLRTRGGRDEQAARFDRVINCTGPDADPRRVESSLVRNLVAGGHMVPDATGTGIAVDDEFRVVGIDGAATDGLRYLGPWLRARDLEATAVHELRRHATSLAAQLRRDVERAHSAAVA